MSQEPIPITSSLKAIFDKFEKRFDKIDDQFERVNNRLTGI